MSSPFILWFDQIGIKDVPLVGGKNASLGEMYSKLSSQGINVPNGFAITATAYKHLLKEAGIEKAIQDVLKGLDTHNIADLRARGKKVREIILNAPFPADLEKVIASSYDDLCKSYNQANVDVAVRSSATAEDLPDASFAGQQETYLNISGHKALIDACHRCFASLFTDRAISYRQDKGFKHFDVYLSIVVQKMVRSDSASSGVMFTMDTESGFDKVVLITGAWGLGENVVQGAVNPDEFYVFKPTLATGHKPVIHKKLGLKQKKMVYATASNAKEPVRNVVTTKAERNSFVLSDDELVTLAKWACAIEKHYGKNMDIEWAKDGDGQTVGSGKLFIVQARPETVHSQRHANSYETYALKSKSKVLVTGTAVGAKIGRGELNIIESASEITKFKPGQVLVTDMTDPDWEPIMKVASAIVTNRGGRTCHAAIISRELGIPCIVGTENGTELLKGVKTATVSCAEGEIGKVYEGLLEFDVQKIDLSEMPKTKTKIMMNVGIPEQAFTQGQIPNDGVGLARLEFIINSHIGIHPLALLNYEQLKKKPRKDDKLKDTLKAIEERTLAYADKSQFFVETLAQGVARIGAGFWPNDVIVRLSDFKSNEYANLIGGYLYEPVEHNPMIGWRGASRYYAPNFEPAFALECEALRRVRNEMGLTNIKVMIPFCRTVEEGKKVIEVMKKYGLTQGQNGLEVYVMCEIPSNVILADQFCEVFDGFSIGSNDLTQLTLGLDRDSELVSHIYNERNEAVKRLVRQVIDTAKKYKRKIGICGQAPSDFPDFAAFLVECGIDSMSLTPDTAIKTRLMVAQKEKELGR
ncbi:MAG: phosphoenolpyruvate synthase [Dissulfuribacterales bacterium]